jgi:hypothetical protein
MTILDNNFEFTDIHFWILQDINSGNKFYADLGRRYSALDIVNLVEYGYLDRFTIDGIYYQLNFKGRMTLAIWKEKKRKVDNKVKKR